MFGSEIRIILRKFESCRILCDNSFLNVAHGGFVKDVYQMNKLSCRFKL